MWTLENKLTELHKELPEESRIEPPNQPQLNLVKEFPERQYQVSFETHYRTYSKIDLQAQQDSHEHDFAFVYHRLELFKKDNLFKHGIHFKALRKIKQDKNYSICKGNLKQLLIDLAGMVHRDH